MKAVVLVSGGLDSAVCLSKAVAEFGNKEVLALTIFYGQKHEKELNFAKALAADFGVEHIIRDMSLVFEFSSCPLLEKNNKEIPKGSYDELQNVEKSGTVSTYVPFRNGLFLSYATAIAYSYKAPFIYYGAHADDATGGAYPDCTAKFRNNMSAAIYDGTGEKVQLQAPLINLNKAQVVALGRSLGTPFHHTWSCYEGGEKQCGKCGTCIDRKNAFFDNGMIDPIEYEEGK